jgi:ABC-type branched-subunit amino acid transport system substrate-binding protein
MRFVAQRPAPRWASKMAVATAFVALIAGGLTVGTTGTALAAGSTGVTSNSITIGATVPLTGVAAPGYDEIAPAMTAVFDWVNAHGGVYGRKIHYDYVDDAYNPSNTTVQTHKLVLQNNIFADVGSLGTPTQAAVQGYLNALKVPQLFVESGCNCWSDPRYPYTTGWQPPYTVDGKILGSYIKSHFAGQKVGELYQDDEFGQDVMKGVNMEIKASSIVSKQTYDVATLAGPLTSQVSALQAAGAQVVVVATVPAATALTLLPAAEVNFKPQWVFDAVGVDPPTVGPLLANFSQGKAGASLLDGIISNAYLPAENASTNPWIQVMTKLLQKYQPSLWKAHGLDGNTEYGVALAYTFVQALQAAGKNLTRQGLINAIAKSGKKLVTPGLVPLSYSSSVHFGFEGDSVVQISSTAPPVVTPAGSFPGFTTLAGPFVTSPGAGPVKKYTGKASKPPAKLASTA